MKPKAAAVRAELRRLRAQVIERGGDPIAARIAYAMETAVRWATEETVGWGGLADHARDAADLIRKEPRP